MCPESVPPPQIYDNFIIICRYEELCYRSDRKNPDGMMGYVGDPVATCAFLFTIRETLKLSENVRRVIYLMLTLFDCGAQKVQKHNGTKNAV